MVNTNAVRASASELKELRRVDAETLVTESQLSVVTITRIVSGLPVQRASLSVALATVRRLAETGT